MATVRSFAVRRGVKLSAGDRVVLRLAAAVTLGFAISLLLDWEFTFLTPMLAFQITAASPVCPNLRQGLVMPLVIVVATTAALAVVTLLADAQAVLIGVLGLVLWYTFYAQRRGAPAIVMLLVQVAFCSIALFGAESLVLAESFGDFLRRSSFAAIASVWISYALIPAPPGANAAAAPAPNRLEPEHAFRVAASDVMVLLPLLAAFMIGGDISNFVILMITINLLGMVELAGGVRLAGALLIGNVMGGVLAVLVQQFVLLADSLLQFLLTIGLAGLMFAGRLVRGGPMAPVFGLAFSTFILLIGLAITPLPGGSEESFVIRILKIAAASLYALGALSLLTGLRRPR